MKAIQRGIVALIAVCWALTGCGGEAEEYTVEEFGQAENGIRNFRFTDDQNVYIGHDGGISRPSGNVFTGIKFDFCPGIPACAEELGINEAIGRLSSASRPVPAGNPTLATATSACGYPGTVSCGAASGFQRDIFYVGNAAGRCSGLSPSTPYLITRINSTTVSNAMRAVQACVNADYVNYIQGQAPSGNKPSARQVYTWLYCRTLGFGVGLLSNSSTNSCMGQFPTTATQFAARLDYNASERAEISQMGTDRRTSVPIGVEEF